MPFKSDAQRKWMWLHHPEMAKEWQAATPKDKKLPEHVKAKKAEMMKTAEPPPPEGVSAKDWDRQLSEGGKIEMEHKDTIKKVKSSPDIPVESAANMIADDHEEELGKKYYPSLKGMEAALEQTKKAAFWDELGKIAGTDRFMALAAKSLHLDREATRKVEALQSFRKAMKEALGKAVKGGSKGYGAVSMGLGSAA